MKKTALVLILSIILVGICFADTIVLNKGQTIQTPTANKIYWQIAFIDAQQKIMRIKYRWQTTAGVGIGVGKRSLDNFWTCKDILDDPTTPVDETDTCFSDIFNYQIRSQDVGGSIGVNLRQLIWAEMKKDILSAGNDGTFE